MLTESQRKQFTQSGVVRLTGVFPETDAQCMCRRIWELLAAKYGIQPHEPAAWTIRQPTGFQSLTRSRVFNPIAGPALVGALDQILGAGAWQQPECWGAPLVTFPGPSPEWQVPHSAWHLDFPVRGPGNVMPGVRVLAFPATVAPRGGGTLVVEGSHLLVERLMAAGEGGQGHSTEIRRGLARLGAWLRDLWTQGDRETRIQRLMVEGGEVEGVPVRVVELTGAPGDVVLMHPWALHAASPNCGTGPRIMVGHSVFRIKSEA
jgi:hypothetical protein